MAEDALTPPADLTAAVQAVEKARAEDPEGRVMKVLYLDDQGEPVGQWHSTQLPENPFDGQMQGLQEPPYRLEQLVALAESHPIHGAALEQKTADIVGKAFEWVADEEEDADDTARQEIQNWFDSLATGEEDMKEIISAAWLDKETLGWGLLEIARDPSGVARQVYHVPAHTVRAHRNGFKLCQIRDNRKVWFRRWGALDPQTGKPVEVDAKTGSQGRVNQMANDMFVIKGPSRRSSWYGIPGYVSAIGWITLALAARDDNLFLFANRREPRWAVILSNLQDDPDIEDQLRRAFQVDMRQPHRNVIIPITGPGKIEFQKLSADLKQDGNFGALSTQANREVMIAHRVPGERLANTDVGALGGNVAEVSNRVYKEAVVTPGQEILQSRLNKFISTEYKMATGAAGDSAAATKGVWRALRKGAASEAEEKEPTQYKLKLDDLDIETDREQLDLTVIAFHGDLITLGEARRRLGMELLMEVYRPVAPLPDPVTGEMPPEPLLPTHLDGSPVQEGEEYPSPLNDLLFTQLPGASGSIPGPAANVPGAGSLAKRRDRDPALGLLLANAREALQQSRAVNERLDELAERAVR